MRVRERKTVVKRRTILFAGFMASVSPEDEALAPHAAYTDAAAADTAEICMACYNDYENDARRRIINQGKARQLEKADGISMGIKKED